MELREYLLHLLFQFRDSRALNNGDGRNWVGGCRVKWGEGSLLLCVVQPWPTDYL